MYAVKADAAVLDEVVRRLVEGIDPDRIILFGSRARGDFQPDSDLDILIIRESNEPRHVRVAKAYRTLRGLGTPKDLLWFTPTEVADWRGVVNHVVWSALREGQVLYEKRP